MIKNSIVGWKSTVGQWAHVDSSSVLGESVEIAAELCINGGIILPHKAIKQSVYEPGTILM
jgi:mannose-1-phosphate guanylyltransferase